MKFLYSILLLFILVSKSASAYNFTISGIVYSNYSQIPVPNHAIYFSANNYQIFDSTLSDSTGFYDITFNIPEDSTYLFNIFTIDSCEFNSSNFSYFINSAPGTYFVDVEVCISISINCQADFIYYELSENTFQFIDKSLDDVVGWFWNFGDGKYSSEKDPIHTFSEEGVFEITLSIITTDSCTSSIQDYIFIMKQTFMTGIVKAGDNLLPQGRIFLFEIDSFFNEYLPIYNTSFPVDNGIFEIPYFYNIPHILYAIPELDVPNNHFPEYFPTYFGDEKYWEGAVSIMPESEDSITINLIKRDSIFYGHGTITGSVNSYQILDSTFLEETCILLLDTEYKPLKYSFLRFDNTFTLNQLPYGDYYLLVDRIGVHSTPLFVSISENHPSKAVVFTVGENGITSLSDKQKTNNEITIFPNPFSNSLTLQFNNDVNSDISISIYNYSGQMIHSEIVSVINNEAHINLSTLNSGIYFIKTPNNTFKVQKVN